MLTYEVVTITGRVGWEARISCSSVTPSVSGRRRSSTSTSGWNFSSWRRASLPLPAKATSYRAAKNRSYVRRRAASSSTNKTLRRAGEEGARMVGQYMGATLAVHGGRAQAAPLSSSNKSSSLVSTRRKRSSSFAPRRHTRSEEHTSELQSQSNLVCRLLLEKNKTLWLRGANEKLRVC